MTKTDLSQSGRLLDDSALVSRSVACLDASYPIHSATAAGGAGGNAAAYRSGALNSTQANLESCSMITLAGRVEPWQHTTTSGDQGPMFGQRGGRQGGSSGPGKPTAAARKARPAFGRRPHRPDWNDSTCVPPKARPVSQLPILPVHGFGCACIGCQMITKGKWERQKELTSIPGKQVTSLPALAIQGSTKNHTRSSTFPVSKPNFALQTQPGTYTRSQIIAGSQGLPSQHFAAKSLPGVSLQHSQSLYFDGEHYVADRQSQLLAWATEQKETIVTRSGEIEKPRKPRRPRPVFSRPSNRPDTVQKPITGARLPKLMPHIGAFPVPAAATALDSSSPSMPPLEEEETDGYPPAEGKNTGGEIDKPSVEYGTPSPCLRAESVHVDIDVDGDTEQAGEDNVSMSSFYSESLSRHGVDSHSDDEEEDDEEIGPSAVELVRSTIFSTDAEDEDAQDTAADATQPAAEDEKLIRCAATQKPSVQPPRRRSDELKELQEFGQWADRFGGGLKGLSMASLIQDCRQAKNERLQKTPKRKNGAPPPMDMSLPSLTALVSDENVKTKLQQRQDQRHKIREIERIHGEIIAMRHRYALQQQEAEIQQEISRSMVFQAMGSEMPDDTITPHGENLSLDDSQYSAVSVAEEAGN